MAMGVAFPQRQRVVTKPIEGTTTGRDIGMGVLGVTGAITGGIAGGPAGAIAGAGGGSSLGAMIGGFFDKKPQDGKVLDSGASPSQAVPLSSAERRIQNSPQSQLATLADGMNAVLDTRDDNLTKMAMPPIYQSYVRLYNQQAQQRQA